jgi:hypothetical protein
MFRHTLAAVADSSLPLLQRGAIHTPALFAVSGRRTSCQIGFLRRANRYPPYLSGFILL